MYGPLVTFAREVRNELRDSGRSYTAEDVAHVMMHRDETLDAFYSLNYNTATIVNETSDAPEDYFLLRILVIRFVAIVVTNEDGWIH